MAALFILGTEGYIELRKYIDIAGRPGGNHLFIVDQQADPVHRLPAMSSCRSDSSSSPMW